MRRAWATVGLLAWLVTQASGQGAGGLVPLPPYAPDPAARSATRIVAAADASLLERRQADLVCDGVGDEQEIQSAIQAIAATGGRVVLSRGTFLLNSPGPAQGCIRLLDNVHLAGQGVGATVLRLRDAHGAAVTGIVRMTSGTSTRSCSLADLTIDGNRADNPAAAGGVTGVFGGVPTGSPPGDEDVRVERVEVQGCNAFGFDFHERTTRLRLQDCLAHDNGLDGFLLEACSDAVVVGCQAWNGDRHGFSLLSGTSGADLIGCIARDNAGNGFLLEDGTGDCALQGGAAHDNGGDGVQLRATENVRVLGLLIRGNGNHGLQLRGARYTQALGNRLSDNSQATPGAFDGLQLVDDLGTGSIRNVIANNTVTGSSHRYAIREEATGQDKNTFTSNIATGATLGNLSITGTNAVLAANQDG